jgi:hypothetical protein
MEEGGVRTMATWSLVSSPKVRVAKTRPFLCARPKLVAGTNSLEDNPEVDS